jgi:hypothetical protein
LNTISVLAASPALYRFVPVFAYLKVIRMLSKPRLRPSHAMAVAIAALVVALGGDAFASIPGPDGTVNSCYSNTNGELRVVDSAHAWCGRGETALRLVAPAGLDFERPYFSFRPGTSGGVTVVAEGGIRSITRLATGKYCVRPIADFDPIAGTVTAEFSNTTNGLAMAFVKTVRSDCPRFSLEVITGRLRNGQFHLSNDVSAVGDTLG